MYLYKDKTLQVIIINFKSKYFMLSSCFKCFIDDNVNNNGIITLKIPEEKVKHFKFKLWKKGYRDENIIFLVRKNLDSQN